jgi:hypothetical protein
VDINITYKILFGRHEGKRPLGRSEHRLEGRIKMDIEDVGYWEMNWIGSSAGLSDFIKGKIFLSSRMTSQKGLYPVVFINILLIGHVSAPCINTDLCIYNLHFCRNFVFQSSSFTVLYSFELHWILPYVDSINLDNSLSFHYYMIEFYL